MTSEIKKDSQTIQQTLQRAATKGASPVPEAIRKDAPNLMLEMPGPFGASLRRQNFAAQLDKDRAQARAVKNSRDTQPAASVISKEKELSQTKDSLAKDFGKSHGRQPGIAFNKARGKSHDRGR